MGRIKKSPSYLLLVGTIYYFRYCTPAKFKHCMSGELRVSLGTSDLDEARIKAAHLTYLTETYLSSLEVETMAKVDRAKVKKALGQLLRQQLENDEAQKASAFAERYKGRKWLDLFKSNQWQTIAQAHNQEHGFISDPLESTEINTPHSGTFTQATAALDVQNAQAVQDMKHQLATNFPGGVDVNVQSFCRAFGLQMIDDDHELFGWVYRELLKVKLAIEAIRGERADGNYNSAIEANIFAQYPVDEPAPPYSTKTPSKRSRGPAKKKGPKLSEAINKFIGEKKSDWAESTLNEYQDRLGLLLDVLGDCSMSRINREKTRRFFAEGFSSTR